MHSFKYNLLIYKDYKTPFCIFRSQVFMQKMVYWFRLDQSPPSIQCPYCKVCRGRLLTLSFMQLIGSLSPSFGGEAYIRVRRWYIFCLLSTNPIILIQKWFIAEGQLECRYSTDHRKQTLQAFFANREGWNSGIKLDPS